MEAALYDPERGYYERRIPRQDFYTAPELHPAFAGVLSQELVRRLVSLKEDGVPGPYSLVEMGSSSVSLSRDILKNLKERHPNLAPQLRYILVERAREKLLESVLALSASHEHILGYSRLEDILPCSGVFFSNELVDAFPVHLLEKREGEIHEVYVEANGSTALAGLSSPELKAHAQSMTDNLQEGERHAVNLEAHRWLKTVSAKLKAGYLLTIDYGKRFTGTPNPPRAFFRHHTDAKVAERPGEKDITASVDFEALILEGGKLGLELECYSTLGRFLVEGGIERWLPDSLEESASSSQYKSRAKIKTLLHPEGMGEVFKVLVQKKRELAP